MKRYLPYTWTLVVVAALSYGWVWEEREEALTATFFAIAAYCAGFMLAESWSRRMHSEDEVTLLRYEDDLERYDELTDRIVDLKPGSLAQKAMIDELRAHRLTAYTHGGTK